MKVGYQATGVCSLPTEGTDGRYRRHEFSNTKVNYKSPVCASWNPECNSSWNIYGDGSCNEDFLRQNQASFGLVPPPGAPGVHQLCGQPSLGQTVNLTAPACNWVPGPEMNTNCGITPVKSLEGFGLDNISTPMKIIIILLILMLLLN